VRDHRFLRQTIAGQERPPRDGVQGVSAMYPAFLETRLFRAVSRGPATDRLAPPSVVGKDMAHGPKSL